MTCAWQAFINLLPLWMRSYAKDDQDTLQEARLRLGQSPEFVTGQGSHSKGRAVQQEDLDYIINSASQYSPWAAGTMAEGYLTGPGGHRIGICGQAIMQNGQVRGMKNPSSLCIRIARDFFGIGERARNISGSLLILGPPGSGKTTLLRDIIRIRSGKDAVSVIDQKDELFPAIKGVNCFDTGIKTDILRGCSKQAGIEMVLRNMGPRQIAVDEITAQEDCSALIQAGWCGVELLATAHAACLWDLENRPVYSSLVQSRLFNTFLVLQPDKSWKVERLK